MERNMNKILEGLHIKDNIQKLPFYNGAKDVDFDLKGLPPMPKGVKTIDPSDSTLEGNYVYVTLSDLNQIKSLVGIPEEVLQKNMNTFPVKVLDANAWKDELDHMDAIRDKAYHYLVNPMPVCKKMDQGTNDMDKVMEYIMDAATEMPIFVANEMVVNDGETLSVKNTPVVIFKKLTIKGSGRMDFSRNGKSKLVTQYLMG